jgi:histidinol-phosphate aminotransferase
MEVRIVNSERNFRWLDKKIEAFRFFDGSLLKYVDLSGNLTNPGAKLETNSRFVKLDSNENFFISPHHLTSIFTDILQNVDLRLYDPASITELKKALGKYEGVFPECLTVSSGSEQLVDLITRLFLEKGDNAVSVVPTFFMYEKRVRLQGAKLVTVPLKSDLSLNKDAILDKLTPRTKLLFICSPNNPTGNQFKWDEIEALVDECSAIVVVDEAYAEFADYSSSSLSAKKRNVIVLKTFSKAFGLAGMRFGYSVAHPTVASVLSAVIPYTVSTVTAKYVLKLLTNLDFIEKSIELVKEERKRLIDELKAVDGIEVYDSKANFVTIKPHSDAEAIYRKLLEKGILIKNLGNLPVIGHCLRVTVGLPQMNSQFLDTLKQVMK